MKSKCKVKLSVHEFDLRKASEYFKTDQFSITKTEDEYFIYSEKFNNTKDTNLISKIVVDYLEKINGILKLKFRIFNPIVMDYLFVFEDENGISKIAAMNALLLGRGDLSTNANNANKEIESQKKKTEDLLNNSIASEVFHFYSKPTSWINLYKIYEIIRDNIGDKKIIPILTKHELSRFTGTAQSIEQLGDDARHASKKYQGHPQPMTLEEADELMKKLIVEWVE